jgi:hypothetical protein
VNEIIQVQVRLGDFGSAFSRALARMSSICKVLLTQGRPHHSALSLTCCILDTACLLDQQM